MKNVFLLFLATLLFHSSFAQRSVQIRNLWAEPCVHVLFGGYTISFSIKDIDRALELLAETGNNTYGATSGLDTTRQYHLELYAGYRTEYHNRLQPMLQLAVGAFLLTKGRAVIRNPKHKKLKSIIVDIQPLEEGEHETDVKFYDPVTGKLIFNGRLPETIKNADLGIDYW
jgi:hypothetical protein